MRLLLPVLALLAAGSGAFAAPPTERTADVGTNIDWSERENGGPARYRIGAVTLTLDTAGDPAERDLRRTILIVAMPGHAPLRVLGVSTTDEGVRVAVGRWGDGRPFVLFQSFTGGTHCCSEVQLILPEGRRLRAIQVGTWDGGFLDLPTDVDGDGVLDFVVRDNRFLYAFASYAGSHAPPQIWNILGGRSVDVSAAPRYRPLFAAAMNEERADCLAGGAEANSPCAAYVAAAARAGQFVRAWREMLPVYERRPEFGMPPGCRVRAAFGACPQRHWIEYPDFPSALRPFLIATGYLPRGSDGVRAFRGGARVHPAAAADRAGARGADGVGERGMRAARK